MITDTETLFGQLNIPPPTGAVDLEARSLKLIAEQRLAEFKRRCPMEFRAPIRRELLPNIQAWDEADRWTPGQYPGLWLWSNETGRAKTRLAWRKIDQATVQLGLRHLFTTGVNLGDWAYECFRDGEPSEFTRRFRNYGLVTIDDIDKYPLNDERMARAFRELFDLFYNRHVSVLVTSNEPIAHIGNLVGESCRRRICEACNEVKF